MRLQRTAAVCALSLGTLAVADAALHAEPVVVGEHAVLRAQRERHPYAATGADAFRTGSTPARAPRERPSPRFSLRVAPGLLTPPAVFRDGEIVAGSRAGLHAIDPATGNERWHAAIGRVPFTPAITDRETLMAIGDGQLWEVDRHGRGRRWGEGVKLAAVAPVVAGVSVLAAAPDGMLHAFESGALRGSLHPGLGSVRTLTLLRDRRVLVTAEGTEVAKVALDASAFERIEIGMRVTIPPVVDRDGAAWLLGHGEIACLLLPSGRVQRIALPEAATDGSAPALSADGQLRIALQSGTLVSIDRNGREHFRRGLDGRPGSLLIDASGHTLLTTARGTLYSIGPDGEASWLVGAGAFGNARPVLGADGSVLLSSRGGQLAAFR